MSKTTHNVVFVSQRFPPDKGGNAARIHDITTHLDNQGWKVTVLSPPPSYPPGEFDRSWQRTETDIVEGVTVHRLWSWQPQTENPGMLRRLAYYLLFGIHAMIWLLWNVRQYDIVVTSTPPISTGAPGLLAATLGKPWIVDVRDLWIDASISLGYLEEGGLIERISRWFQQQVLSTSDRIAVTTNSLGDSLQQTYGKSLGEKIILIPNGVDVERFQPSPDQESEMNTLEDTSERNKSAYADGPRAGQSTHAAVKADDATPTIIYTGNLGSAQDLESCIRAMNYLSHDSAVLRLVGRGDVESELQRCADEHGLENRVEFEGIVPRTEIPALLKEATIGVAPLRDTEQLSYAMPTKVYEYMATGLPTVATGQGEIEQFMNESGGGIHVENNPQKIATTFDNLLADKQRRRQLGSNGREYIQEMYDRKSIAHQLGTELTGLLEDKNAE